LKTDFSKICFLGLHCAGRRPLRRRCRRPAPRRVDNLTWADAVKCCR